MRTGPNLESWERRPPAEADAAAVTALYLRSDAVDLGQPDTDEDDVTAVWRWPSFDLARDALLVVDGDGTPIGYAWAHRGRQGDLVVDPAWRGRGLGRALLAWTVERATAQSRELADPAGEADEPAWFELSSLATVPAAAALLREVGFQPWRVTLTMSIDLEGPPPEPVWPEGVTLRPFERERDGHALHGLVNATFRDVEGWEPRPFEEFAAYTFDRSAFDPGLVLQAEAGGALVGMAMSFDFEGDGFVQYLAVAREWRRRGLALALLHQSFAVLGEHGAGKVELLVDADNSTGATRLYESAGMREAFRWVRWRLALPTA